MRRIRLYDLIFLYKMIRSGTFPWILWFFSWGGALVAALATYALAPVRKLNRRWTLFGDPPPDPFTKRKESKQAAKEREYFREWLGIAVAVGMGLGIIAYVLLGIPWK